MSLIDKTLFLTHSLRFRFFLCSPLIPKFRVSSSIPPINSSGNLFAFWFWFWFLFSVCSLPSLSLFVPWFYSSQPLRLTDRMSIIFINCSLIKFGLREIINRRKVIFDFTTLSWMIAISMALSWITVDCFLDWLISISWRNNLIVFLID